MARRSPTEMDAALTAHENDIRDTWVLAERNRDQLANVQREHEGEIKLLKDQVATLKAESKAREGHDAEIKVLRKEVEVLKEDNKAWKVWFNALSAAVVGALILAALGLRK